MISSAAFGLALLAATLLACNAGPSMRRTGFALSGCWFACIDAVLVSGRVDPWFAFAAFDAVAAVIVLAHPSSRPQAYIGCIYIVQVTVHLAYALVGSGPATGLYLTMLTGGGWLQIAVLAGGAIYGQGKRRAVGRGMGGGGASAAEARASGLASGE